ncbi:MAG: transglycosylase domain-containing protein [Polyangiaceae bacterium]|nr:transglycosylase domain-containing protein [Polyangiaceae bacterium]
MVRIDSRRLADTEVELDVADGCEFISVPAMAEIYRFEQPFAHQVVEPDGRIFTMTTGPGSASWVSFPAIHPNVITAVISHEDASFFRHSGFAPWAIREALVRNLEAGAFRYGASTISMQLSKNLFLRREKTLVRKIQEVFLTWWLERALEKNRILELYLNVIEYGPGIYGIRNATQHYFGREPSDISPAEAAFLANVLPSPKSYAGMYLAGVPSESTLRRMEQFLRHMHARGRIGADALAYGLGELSNFAFHREGAPRPPARSLPGDAASPSYDANSDGEAPLEDEWTDSAEKG